MTLQTPEKRDANSACDIVHQARYLVFHNKRAWGLPSQESEKKYQQSASSVINIELIDEPECSTQVHDLLREQSPVPRDHPVKVGLFHQPKL